MRKSIFILILLLTCLYHAKSEIVTPYPLSFDLKQINSAEKERIRLCQTQKKYDKQPTGFYIESGKKIVVNVEILIPAENNVMPVITVGTLGFNVGNRSTGISTTLIPGENIITNHTGGLIWLSFTQSAATDPKGMAKVSFTSQSEHVRVPRFVFGTTTNAEFTEMLTAYPTPDVLFQSDYALVVATKEAANQISNNVNKVVWLNAIHTLIDEEDKISGLDNNDPNPLHHRMKLGEVRFLLTQNTSLSPHASSAGYTGYPSGSISRYLTPIGTSTNNSWMLGHEIGHQHQQSAYLINKATESTVNIYSYVVERNIQGPAYIRTSATRWQQVHNSYLKLPLSKRIYDMNDDSLRAITGYNHDETRFMVWEQLFLIFGDKFFKTLHRVVREEKEFGGDPDQRRAYLIWKSSQITGYDLTEFFNLWGIRVADSQIKANLRAKMFNAKSKSEILDLSSIGRNAEEFIRVSGQSLPSWAPISLRGISSSISFIPEVLDKTDWTITSSYSGVSDSSIGGDDASYIIDSNPSTAFAFIKPGKSYSGISIPVNTEVSFTVDMKKSKSFNYVKYTHRTGNTTEWIRARQLSVYGSNDGIQFSAIKEHVSVDFLKNADDILIEFNPVNFRFVKVVIENWNYDSGSTIQVSEFNVGTKSIEEVLPIPEALKFNVKLTADEGILSNQMGINLADEDSDYTLYFTLASGRSLSKVTVDGDPIMPDLENGTYSFTVKVVNHLDVVVSSNDFTALENVDEKSNIRIFPNPVKLGEKVKIQLEGELKGYEISLYSHLGTKIDQNLESNFIQIDIPGTYIIKLSKGEKCFHQKIIVG